MGRFPAIRTQMAANVGSRCQRTRAPDPLRPFIRLGTRDRPQVSIGRSLVQESVPHRLQVVRGPSQLASAGKTRGPCQIRSDSRFFVNFLEPGPLPSGIDKNRQQTIIARDHARPPNVAKPRNPFARGGEHEVAKFLAPAPYTVWLPLSPACDHDLHPGIFL